MTKRSTRIIKFIETYCCVPEGKHIGKPIKLAAFQKQFIRDVYDNKHGTRRAYLSIARKNGKSATIACLLLAHLVGPEAVPNSQIVSGARSRDQAALVFALATKIINLSERLREIIHVTPSSKKLVGLPRNVEYRALSADGSTAHGLSPVLAILDEVGQVRGPQDDFIDAITTSQGAHERPLLIAISTQAPTDADLFSIWLDDAKTSSDTRIVSHVYEAPEDCGLLDEAAWSAANPALKIFRSYEDIKEQATQAERMPSSESTFRNLSLNQRVNTVSPFISAKVWKENGAVPGELDPKLPCYAGLDLSSRADLTALIIVQENQGIWHVESHFWTPQDSLFDRAKRDRAPYDVWARDGWLHTTPGSTVDYGYVAIEMGEIFSNLNLAAIGYDRWRMDVLKKELDAIGLELPLEPHGQGYKDMSPALDAVEADLLNGRMAHGLHPVLTMCAANAVVSMDPSGNRKLDKHKATGRIDGMVALAMAKGVAAEHIPATGKLQLFTLG